MNERIRELRKSLGLTQAQFADRLGVKRGAIANYELGRNTPIDAVTSLICREFKVNEEWLRTGEGEMFLPGPSSTLDALADEFHLNASDRILVQRILDLKPEQRQAVVDFARELAVNLMQLEEQQKQHLQRVRLSYYGKIAAAGFAVDSFSALMEGTIEVAATEQALLADYAIGVSGESMEPVYQDGEIVLVKKTEEVPFGEVGIFQKGNELYIKQRTAEGLRSFNKGYKLIPPDEDIYCLGRVIGKAQKP